MDSTYHTLLVGDDATRFAICKNIFFQTDFPAQGFPTRNMTANNSIELWEQWIANNHQPNFWKGNHDYNGTNYRNSEEKRPVLHFMYLFNPISLRNVVSRNLSIMEIMTQLEW